MLATIICILIRHSFQEVPDQVTWKAGPSATFIVRSQYQFLKPLRPQDRAIYTLWNLSSPPKVKITMWLAVHDRLPTDLYLHRRHIRLRIFCENHPESSTHIFLLCDFVRRVWAPVVSSMTIPTWPSSLRHLWEDWQTLAIPEAVWKIWDIHALAVIWSIWTERDSRIFAQKLIPADVISRRHYFSATFEGKILPSTHLGDCPFLLGLFLFY